MHRDPPSVGFLHTTALIFFYRYLQIRHACHCFVHFAMRVLLPPLKLNRPTFHGSERRKHLVVVMYSGLIVGLA